MARKIAIVGGTGAEGSGLAYRLAKAGEYILIGSRDAAREPIRMYSPAFAKRYASPEPSAPVPPTIAILRAMKVHPVSNPDAYPELWKAFWLEAATSLFAHPVWYLQKLPRCQSPHSRHPNSAKPSAISPPVSPSLPSSASPAKFTV